MSGEDKNSGGEEKSHLPTQRKLDQSRKEGDVPYSTEITTAATYAAFYLVLIAAGGWSVTRIWVELAAFFHRPADIGAALLWSSSGVYLRELVAGLFLALTPFFGALAATTIVSLVAQRAVAFAPKKLKPKWSRLSVISNAKQKYGPNGLFEFFKSAAKLSAVILILIFGLKDRFLELPQLSALSIEAFGPIIQREAVTFLGLVTLAAAAVAAIDFPWRRFQHEKRLMMTFDELKKENKETEGDPALKNARRERGAAIARNKMMADVPKSTVVIVNPTHYAVALAWDRENGGAPVCMAKGVDVIAARIREIAAEAGVPIRRDPPTARSIYALVEVGDEVRKEHYAAVAAAIHYADEIQRKSKTQYAP